MSAAAAIRPPHERLASLDAYRGFVMICLVANGFGIAQVAKNFPDHSGWQWLAYQFEHVPWVGCAFWDLIQPSFMFMVGVALPFSLAKRRAEGANWVALWGHAILRSLTLVALGIFLRSNGQAQTNYTFMDVLTQIGLGYWLLFLMALWPRWVQGLVGVVLLAGYWAWFASYPLPPADLDLARVGLPADWPMLTGFEAHWQKNLNAAADFDLLLLNQFPRPEPYTFNSGGYQTLNFIPSLVTMLFGVITGDVIRQTTSGVRLWSGLVIAGLIGLIAGWSLDAFGICPLVKRIWTPSWTLYSTGWTLLMLAAFYGLIDVLGVKAWSFPLRVAGMNSIALYVMGSLLKPWTRQSLATHFGKDWANWFGQPYIPLVDALVILTLFWLFAFWLYRQRAFLKL